MTSRTRVLCYIDASIEALFSIMFILSARYGCTQAAHYDFAAERQRWARSWPAMRCWQDIREKRMKRVPIHEAKAKRLVPPVCSVVFLFMSLLGYAAIGFAAQKDAAQNVSPQGTSWPPLYLDAPRARDPIF